jgi:hypothetical protein
MVLEPNGHGLEKMTTFCPPEASAASDGEPERFSNFWGEIAPSEHLVQIYKDDEVFLDSLEGFVAGGIRAGDGVIVIAVPAHLAALEHRLLTRGIDPLSVIEAGQYVPLDAKETLSKFMIENRFGDGKTAWPDEDRFHALVTELVTRCSTRPNGTRRRVRAFGEMVALLWAEGMTGATIRLEALWHQFCQRSSLCLFCAYPRAYFTNDPEASIKQICATHSRVVPNSAQT